MSKPSHHTFSGELRSLLHLSWPLIGNNLAVAGMNFADAVMAGRLGGRDLAAVAIGNSSWMLFFLAGLGILMAMSPLISHAYGAREFERIGGYVRAGAVIAAVFGVAVVIVLHASVGPLVRAIGIDESFRDLAIGYAESISWGAPAILGYLALRYTHEGIARTRPIIVVSMFALVVNVAGNYIFMYGHFGAPALGAVGCGVASAIAMWLMLIAFLGYVLISSKYEEMRRLVRNARTAPGRIREVLGLGIPIAANICAEVGLFVAISMIMGTLSASAAAAHQIAINYTSVMFMIPMALASAITVRVGHALGEGDPALARSRGYVGIACCFAFMLLSALVLLVFRDAIVRIYTTDPAVTSIAVSLLFMAAIFQVSDGVQVGVAGALRGYKDARVPLVLNLTAYWVIGFPLAYAAINRVSPTPAQVWLGFVVGLTIAAVLLLIRYHYLTRRFLPK